MINCVRDDKKTVVSASGDAPQVAADCCEVIRAIYFEIPVEVRPLFKECVLLAVNHKDSPMWQSPPPSSERVVIRSEGKEFLKQAKDLFGGGNRPEGGGGSMTRVDLTKAQCAELANYLRGILNNGMCAGNFDRIEMLVLARRALAAAEEMPEASSVSAHAPAARKPQPEDASAAGSPASEAAQLKRDTLERLTAYRQKDGLNSLTPLAAACGKVDGEVISAELLARMLNRERFPVAIWREVAAALDKIDRKKGAEEG